MEHTCKIVLSHDNNGWVKKEMPMGSFFGVELCDLIGLYILNLLKLIYGNNEVGLSYSD